MTAVQHLPRVAISLIRLRMVPPSLAVQVNRPRNALLSYMSVKLIGRMGVHPVVILVTMIASATCVVLQCAIAAGNVVLQPT